MDAPTGARADRPRRRGDPHQKLRDEAARATSAGVKARLNIEMVHKKVVAKS